MPAPKFVPGLARLEDRSVPAAIGAVDPTFGTTGKVTLDLGAADQFNAVVVQPDQKILLAGTTASEGDPAADFVVVRLNPNGTLDPTFGANGVAVMNLGGADVATGLAVTPDGRIVVGGYSTTAAGSDFAVARLLPNGVLDGSFAGGQVRLPTDLGTDKAYGLALTPSGRVYLAGTSGTNIALARVDESGNVDRGFGPANKGVITVDLGGTEEGRGVVVLADGRAVVGGFSNAPSQGANFDFVAVRFAPDGTATDFGFGDTVLNNTKVARVDFGGDDKAYAVALDPQSRVVLAGTNGGPLSDFAVARLDVNGLRDSGFLGNGARLIPVGGAEEARAVAVTPDGQIVVGGFSARELTAGADFAAIRLRSDGTDDPAFGGARTVDLGGDDRAFGTAVDADGRVLLAGRSSFNAAAARLFGTVGLSDVLLVSGLPDASGRQYVAENGQLVAGPAFNVFPGFTGTVRVATGDVNGDGVPDRIAGAGPGGGPVVNVYDGKTGGLLASFAAFEPSYTGGVLLAAGDFTGDGKAEVVVTADVGGGPRVRVYDGAGLVTNNPAVIADFLGIEDPNFRGGARPAVGDVNGDGTPDLVIAAGVGGGPRVAIFDGKSLAPGAGVRRLVPDFFVFEPSVRNGAWVAAGDVNGDGFDDVIAGGGPSGGPRVRILSGKTLVSVGAFESIDAVPGLQLASFLAGPEAARGGVQVAAKDVDGDQFADVVTGSGQGLRSEVRVYEGATLLANGTTPNPDQILDPFAADLPGGVFVG